jgi:hypothetical protein
MAGLQSRPFSFEAEAAALPFRYRSGPLVQQTPMAEFSNVRRKEEDRPIPAHCRGFTVARVAQGEPSG